MNALRELVQYSHLILSFAQRDIRARYKQTAFGVGWAIIQPFSLMVAFTVVFGQFANVPSDGVPYPVFAYTALIFWTFFTTTVSQGTVAMTANSSLVRKIYFPRETLLLAVLLSAGLDLAIAFTILIGLFLYYQVVLTWTLLWIVPLLALQVVFMLGIICVTSTVHVYLRDVGHALPLGLQLWMFATPVAYPLDIVPERLLPIYLLNPMAHIIANYRRVLLHGQPPDLAAAGAGFVTAVVLLTVAYVVFKRGERTFADVI
jgi:lipopolysaccharide transport system permease protein